MLSLQVVSLFKKCDYLKKLYRRHTTKGNSRLTSILVTGKKCFLNPAGRIKVYSLHLVCNLSLKIANLCGHGKRRWFVTQISISRELRKRRLSQIKIGTTMIIKSTQLSIQNKSREKTVSRRTRRTFAQCLKMAGKTPTFSPRQSHCPL